MADLRYLEYLRKLNKIVIPKEFTYFVHNTLYGKNEKPYDKMWEELPTDSFTVNRDMSFVERDDRVKEAFDYGGVTKAANSYSVNSRGKNFQIRLLMPKRFLSKEQLDELDITPEEQKLLRMEYNGLGDQRHPKIKRNEKKYIFASSQKDEISGENIDILYGIREQDIERYAKLVHKALKNEQTQDFKMTDETLNYTIGDNREEALSDYYDSTKLDYTLDNDGLGRYTKQALIDSNGNPSLTIPSKFEQEFLKEQGIELPSKERWRNVFRY